MNVTRYSSHPVFFDSPDPLHCRDDNTPPVTPEKFCQTNLKSALRGGVGCFRQARTAPDQLRLRMAHAWHQIFVVQMDGFAYGSAEFHQRLRDDAFGTFENLLLKYALSPQLGHFQNWVQNEPRTMGSSGPTRTFARELMQLFTIGVNALNDDGTPKLDGSGHLILNYTQADIEMLVRVLTGFAFPTQPGNVAHSSSSPVLPRRHVPFDAFHDQGVEDRPGQSAGPVGRRECNGRGARI